MYIMQSLSENLDGLFAPILQATGIPSAWFFIAILFLILFVIFLVLVIVKFSTVRKLKKHIAAQDEYILGLEASSDLPQIKMPDKSEFSSIVFASDKERKKKKKKANKEEKKADKEEKTDNNLDTNASLKNIKSDEPDKQDESELVAKSIDAQVPEINLAKEKNKESLSSDDIAAIVHDIVLQSLSNSVEKNKSSELKNADDVKEAISNSRKQESVPGIKPQEEKSNVDDLISEQEKEVQRILAKILVSNKDNNDSQSNDHSQLDKSIPEV